HRLPDARRRGADPADPVLSERPAGHRARKVAAMAAVTPLIETRGLTRHFGGLKAVESVDFRLEEGEIRAIIGPNGAGKTTFVSLICGRIPPSSGEILFAGRDITRLAAHERVLAGIAYTFQITSIFPRLSVYDNV